MAQLSAHRNDLALVMEGMGKDVMQNECRRADGFVSIGEMKLRIQVELLIRQVG